MTDIMDQINRQPQNEKISLILVKTFQAADWKSDQPPAYILHLTVAILFTSQADIRNPLRYLLITE